MSGVRLRYAQTGSGKRVSFLHGSAACWYQRKAQLEDIGQDYMAVAPDMRGYHLWSIPSDISAYRIRTLVDDTRTRADHVGQRKFVLAGYDRGGLVPWSFAMCYPSAWTGGK